MKARLRSYGFILLLCAIIAVALILLALLTTGGRR